MGISWDLGLKRVFGYDNSLQVMDLIQQAKFGEYTLNVGNIHQAKEWYTGYTLNT